LDDDGRRQDRQMDTDLSSESIVVAARDQVSCNLAGEIAILSLAKGMYYGLDQIGAQVWTLLQEPKSVAEICDAILREYEVEPDCCHNDLLALLGQLQSAGLIEVRANPEAQMAQRLH
jgi:hypothetical protein